MMSTTHIVIGIAAALTVTQPDSAEALLPVIAGASVGSIICDIDCRGKRTGGSRSRMLRDAIIGRVIVAGLLVAVLFIDYWLGSPIFTRINNLTPAFLIALFVFIVCCGFSFLSEHRGFSHSIIALGLYSGSLYVMITPVTVPFAFSVTVARTVPDLDYICVCDNRLWGCKGDTIYASKLGDPLNWNVFDGLSTDSWTAETGTEGIFTGCCSFQGYPTFFKDDAVYKVLGDEPGNFVLRRQNIVGVAEGSNKSIVEIRGRLYYISHIGAVEWNGGDYPTIVSHALGSAPGTMSYAPGQSPKAGKGAVAGTDGIRYFVYAYHTGYHYSWLPDGQYSKSWSSKECLFVYDPRFGTWHERKVSATGYRPEFVGDGSTYYMLEHTAELVEGSMVYQTVEHILSQPGVAANNPNDSWRVLFADSTRAYKTALTGSESKKGVLRLLIRCRLAKTMKVWISYDGGDFEEAGEFGGEDGMAKSSRVVPLILRRCDYWQLRLTGVGDAVIYSIAVEKYGGEWQQA